MNEVPIGAEVHVGKAADELDATFEHRVVAAPRSMRRDVIVLVCALAALAWFLFDPQPVPILSSAALGFHELGHLLAWLLPPVGQALAGSIVQLGVPLALAAYFAIRHEGLHASGAMLAWAGLVARDVGSYVADAPFQRLPLAFGEHDWAFILGPQGWGRMDLAASMGASLWWFGLLCILVGGSLAVIELVRTVRWERHRVAEMERLRTLPRHEPHPAPMPGIDPDATPLEPGLTDPFGYRTEGVPGRGTPGPG